MTECEVCVSFIAQSNFHIIFHFQMNVVKLSTLNTKQHMDLKAAKKVLSTYP